MSHPAVLVIDVQRTLSEGQWAAWEVDRVIERINVVTSRARDAGVPVVLVQHEEDDGPMVRDTPGWQLAPGLQVAPGDLHVHKRACDAFHATPLAAMLRERGVDRLVVCGMQTDFCVDSTVRRALTLGFPVTLVTDGHTTLDTETLKAPQIVAHHQRTLSHQQVDGHGVTLAAADDIRF